MNLDDLTFVPENWPLRGEMKDGEFVPCRAFPHEDYFNAKGEIRVAKDRDGKLVCVYFNAGDPQLKTIKFFKPPALDYTL